MNFAPPRTLLFIPASRADFVAKAHLRGADAIILDLEDGVAAHDKPTARSALQEMQAGLAAQGLAVWVRINPLGCGGETDLEVIARLPRPTTVMLPKTETPDQVQSACDRLASLGAAAPFVPLIETPAGVIRAADIAKANADVWALAFGSEDFAASLGVAPTEAALAAPAQWVVLAAAAAGLPAFGLPGSLANFADLEPLEQLGGKAAAIGFSGALCIHPAQVAVLNACFSPTARDIEWAGRVLNRPQCEGNGATALDGAMVDPPVIARARRIMDRAQRR